MANRFRIYRKITDNKLPDLPPQGLVNSTSGIYAYWETENKMFPEVQEGFFTEPPENIITIKELPTSPAYTTSISMFTIYGIAFRTDVMGKVSDGDKLLKKAYIKWSLKAKSNPFVDDYVQTVDDILDGLAPIEFQEALSIMLLSLLLTPHIVLYTPSENVHTNLYMMLIGESSTTYKTSSMKKLKQIITSVEAFNQEKNCIVSMNNFTAESFPRWISANAGRMIFSYEDEADGFISQANQKTYMKGVLPLLTNIYTVNQVESSRMMIDRNRRQDLLSKQSDGKNLTEEEAEELKDKHVALLNCLWGGTPSALLGSMSKQMFESGFLPRFSFIVGKPKAFDPNRGFIHAKKAPSKTMVLGDNKGFNPTLRAFSERVAAKSRLWSGMPRGQVAMFSLTPESESVVNQWDGEVMGIMRTHFPQLTSAQSRTRMIALKVATLFSAWRDEKDQEISAEDMKQGIKYAMRWFMNTREIYDSLSETTHGALQSQIEAVIKASPNGIAKNDLAKRFERLVSRRDLQEALKAMSQDQEVITTVLDKQAKGGFRWVINDPKNLIKEESTL